MPLPHAGVAHEQLTSVLLAAKTGAPWAFRELWHEFAPAIAAYVRARGSHEPDDVTSEVFLTAFDRLAAFEGDVRQFRAFLFTLAHRRLVDELRARSRRPNMEELTEEEDRRSVESAESAAIDRMADRQVIALVEELAPDQRDVLVLRIVGDLTIPEIAEILSKRPGAVKALQRRGLEALRKKIAPGRTLSHGSDD